jgi:hypothetical protein
MNDTEQLNSAIAAHGRWKARLRHAVETGKSELTSEAVRADNLCEFGKWLGSCSAAEKTTERWKKIRALHAEFHKEAARILVLAIAGRKGEAETALALGSPFSKISADLTLALVAWRDSRPDVRR